MYKRWEKRIKESAVPASVVVIFHFDFEK